jgi:hypothetical protein
MLLLLAQARCCTPCQLLIVVHRAIAEGRPSAGVEDLVIVPLVVIALAVSKLLKAVLSILIYVLDYAFPILLQLMRIPLLAARLIGDGMELFFEGVVRCLPVLSQPIRQRQATRRIIPLAVRRV